MKDKAVAVYGRHGLSAANAERIADHMAVCSCWGCGNPRRHMKGVERITMQERRAEEAASFQD